MVDNAETYEGGRQISALDALQAVLLLSKHLADLLPFFMAVRRIPAQIPQRVGLIQQTARRIAGEGDFARDWYQALELLTGENLSTRSVADLILMTPEVLGSPALGDVWRAAFDIGLLDEDLLQQWVFVETLTETEV